MRPEIIKGNQKEATDNTFKDVTTLFWLQESVLRDKGWTMYHMKSQNLPDTSTCFLHKWLKWRATHVWSSNGQTPISCKRPGRPKLVHKGCGKNLKTFRESGRRLIDPVNFSHSDTNWQPIKQSGNFFVAMSHSSDNAFIAAEFLGIWKDEQRALSAVILSTPRRELTWRSSPPTSRGHICVCFSLRNMQGSWFSRSICHSG